MKVYMTSDIHLDHYFGSNTTVTAIKKYLEKVLLPADVLCIAGDISDHTDVFAKGIDAACDLYKDVVFCLGNHDYAIHRALSVETSDEKVRRMLGKIKSKNSHIVDGNVVEINKIKFGGTFSGYDFSYSYKHFGLTEEEMLQRWKSWYDGRFWNFPGMSPLDIFKKEYKKLQNCIDEGVQVMLTHTGPLAYQIKPEYHNFMTGYFYFDGMKLLDQMPEGSIWQYGHTHDSKYLDLGNVRLFANPEGYPGEIGPHTIAKEKYLVEL